MAKPNYYPEWASLPTADKIIPNSFLKQNGYSFGDIPSHQHWNWLFNNIYEWIQFFDGSSNQFIKTKTELEAFNSTDISDKSIFVVKNYGIYYFDINSNLPADGTYIIATNDNIGRFFLVIPAGLLLEEVINDKLGLLNDLIKWETIINSNKRIGLANTNIPIHTDLPLGHNLVWTGRVYSCSDANSYAGQFFGVGGGFSTTGQGIKNGHHIVEIRGYGTTDEGMVMLTGCRLTMQAQEDFTTERTGSRWTFFTNPTNADASTSQTAFLINSDRSLTTYGHIVPNTTNIADIGSASNRYSNIYLVNNPNVSSDERLKRDINSLKMDINTYYTLLKKLDEKDAYIKFKYKPIQYNDEIFYGEDNLMKTQEKTVNHNRFHLGLSAQKLIESILESGLTTYDSSLVSIENFKDDDLNNIYSESIGTMSVAYSEFIPIILLILTDINKRLENIELQLGE